MDTVLDVISFVLDKASRSALGVAIFGVLVLGAAFYVLFGTPIEFIKLVILAIVVAAYLAFLWVTGHI